MKLFKNEDGQALILVSLLMVVLLGFAALAIDIGLAYVAKSELQSAADSSALAGAGVQTNKVEAAISVAKENHVESGVEGTSIIVNSNPVVGTSEATHRSYTSDEISAIKTELAPLFNAKSNEELIDLAKENAVTAGIGTTTTLGSHTTGELASKSDAELMQLAKDNSLTNMLVLSNSKEIRKTELTNLSDKDLVDLAYTVVPDIQHNSSLINKNKKEIQNGKKGEVIALILNKEFENKTITTEYTLPLNKTVLIQAIVDELNKKESKVETTITDKNGLIQALIKKETDEGVTEGKVKGNSSRVRVDIIKDVSFSFARVLNINGTKVSVHAVAEKESWAGDALPFINLDGDAEKSLVGQPLSAWNMTGPGDKERISNNDLIISSNSIQVKYSDGIEFKKGKVMSAIKDPLKKIAVKGNVVYVFSIKKDEISNYQKGNSKELKNGDVIPLNDIVLLKCEVVETWGGTGADVIELKFLDSFSWNGSAFISSTGERPDDVVKLVE